MIGKCKDCEYRLKTRTDFMQLPEPPVDKEITEGVWFWKKPAYEYRYLEHAKYYHDIAYYYEDIKRVHLCAIYPKHAWYPADHGCGQFKLKDGIILE